MRHFTQREVFWAVYLTASAVVLILAKAHWDAARAYHAFRAEELERRYAELLRLRHKKH